MRALLGFSLLIVSSGLVAHEPAAAEAGGVPLENRIVRHGEGVVVNNPFHPATLLLASRESQGDLTIYEFLLPPRSPGSPPHTHTREDEYFYVVSGQLNILSGSETKVLNPGDFAALNRGNAHMFWNGGDVDARLIMATGGGSFEAFMADAAAVVEAAKPQTQEDFGAAIGRHAAAHGIYISMDQMPPEAAPYYLGGSR